CATARSVASRQPRPPRETRTRPGCELDERHDPRGSVAVVELIEPTLAVATDPIMRTTNANTCLGSRACHHSPLATARTLTGQPPRRPINQTEHRQPRAPATP